MTMQKMRLLILLFVGAIFIYSCQQFSDAKLSTSYLDLPIVPYNYISDTANNYIPTLGRVLFYDSRLSANNSVSCATCHKQALAFADNAQFSRGFAGQLTGRNSMPIQNLTIRKAPTTGGVVIDSGFVFSNALPLFWDGRETLVEAMVLRPITNHVEMGMTLDELIKKLSQLPEYKPLFKDAYGSEEITEGKIGVALGQFIANINSNNSKFDDYVRGSIQLSAVEEIGRTLFFNKYNCNNCHQVIPSGFSIYQFNNFVDIGLDQAPQDKGRADVTFNSEDVGKFKIPKLQNVVLTSPYMHDGRFATLDEVIDHYSTNILYSPNLDTLLKHNGLPKQMLISQEEKIALISFLHTLTDYQMITDPKYSSPFKVK